MPLQIDLQIDDSQPALTVEQTLTGWRREFCVELLGEGRARIFLRSVESASLKATELRRGVLFHRVNAAFNDLAGCVESARAPLEALAGTASRSTPTQDNLFSVMSFDRNAWDRVEYAVEQWQRRPPAASYRPQLTAGPTQLRSSPVLSSTASPPTDSGNSASRSHAPRHPIPPLHRR